MQLTENTRNGTSSGTSSGGGSGGGGGGGHVPYPQPKQKGEAGPVEDAVGDVFQIRKPVGDLDDFEIPNVTDTIEKSQSNIDKNPS